MVDEENNIKLTNPEDLLRLLKDLLALDLSPEQAEKVRLFMLDKEQISLGDRKYTKTDLKDLFYSNN